MTDSHDQHLARAARTLGISYEEAERRFRSGDAETVRARYEAEERTWREGTAVTAAKLIVELQKLDPSTPVFLRGLDDRTAFAVASLAVEPGTTGGSVAVLDWRPESKKQ